MRAIALFLLASGLLPAQVPRIGVIDFYGLHKVSPDHVRKVMRVTEGDRLPASKGDVEERLQEIPGVVRSRLEAVCCEGDRAILYVGIEEKDAPHFEFRLPPRAEVSLPSSLVDAYAAFLRVFKDAARRGVTAEDISRGESLSFDPATRSYQQRFRDLAKENVAILRSVLRESADPEQRAIAACVIGYAPDKRTAAEDLQYAMQDADESVRANAMRSLGAIAALATRKPELGLRVQPTWFIEMLKSIVWSDRIHSAEALVGITESRPRYVLQQLRERALDALVEMARWKTLSHALPAFLLLGRTAGVPEEQIHEAWKSGDREALIRKALSRQ